MKNNIDVDSLVSLIKNLDYSMLSDAEWNELKMVDVSNAEKLTNVINDIVVPEYESLDVVSKNMIRVALIGVLSLRGYDFDRVLDRIEMPFLPFSDSRAFFLLIWKAIFKDNFE